MPDEIKRQMDETQVSYWLNEIKSCEEKKLTEMRKRNAYPDLIKYYEGEQYTKDSTQRLAIQNDFFPNTNSLRAEIMYQNPEILLEAMKPDAEDNTDTMKGALTYAIKKLDMLTENKIALFDMLYAGICGVEVNYIVKKPKVKPQEEKSLIGKMVDGIKKFAGREQVEEEVAEESPSKEELYSGEETYIRRWSPLDFGFDYRAERIKDNKYVYKIIRKTKAEFDKDYPEFADKVTGGEIVPYTFHTKEEDKKTVLIYEVQQKKEDDKFATFLLTPSYKWSEIDYFEREYTANGFNLKIGILDDYGKAYPISRAKINKQGQDDKNNYITFVMEVAERNIPKIGYNEKNVKAPALEALRSNKVNDIVAVSGGQENIWPISPTNVSSENKELIALFDKKKEELWGVSAARVSGRGDAKFMGELDIQEAGFQERRIDIQEGLRQLIKMELDTLKDIIVQYWDDEHWFKITGKGEPTWYTPQTVINPQNGQPMVLNPLTEILSMDYEVDVDIMSSLKPNSERIKKEEVEYLTWLTSPDMLNYLASQGKTVNVDMIKNTATKFGYQKDTLLIDLQPPPIAGMSPEGAQLSPGQIPEEMIANAPV